MIRLSSPPTTGLIHLGQSQKKSMNIMKLVFGSDKKKSLETLRESLFDWARLTKGSHVYRGIHVGAEKAAASSFPAR